MWALVALLLIAGIVALIFAFRGSKNTADDVTVIYTNAAMTFEVQQLTLQASQPSATPTAIITITPLATVTPFPTLALPSQSAFSTSTPLAGSSAVGCDNSVYISDVTIPDNTVVTPGQALTKTWRVQNNGTCAWTATYQITFILGDAMGGKATPIGVAVSPGGTVDISVAMVAPAKAGVAAGTWKLVNDKSQQFGTPLTIVVNVSGTTGTPAKTATPTTPAPVVTPPAAASNLAATPVCNAQDISGATLNWQDNATNEDGFKIYVNGVLNGSVAANVTTYQIPASSYGNSLAVSVEAYNSAGASSRVDLTVTCPN